MLFISNHRIQFSEKQFACRDCDKKFNVAICALSNSHWWKAVRLSWMWQENRMYIGYMMLHHRIQTDWKGVYAGVQASTPCTSGLTPCTSGSTKSCADCRALCEYDRMQEVAGCSRLHAGGCSLHAGFMQPAYDRTQEVAGCSILHAGCSRLHAGCMQPACSLHAACMHL